MPGLDPGIHVVLSTDKNVDGQDKPGHDGYTYRSQDTFNTCPFA
jgi:hypothetical protein